MDSNELITRSRVAIRLSTTELITHIRAHKKLHGEDMKSDVIDLIDSALTPKTH